MFWKNPLGYIKAFVSAARAGYIAQNCTHGCVIDDENEEIRPCFLHAREIGELYKQNERDFPK